MAKTKFDNKEYIRGDCMIDKKDAPNGYEIYADIRNKYHKGYKRKDSEVTHLIIHGTAGGQSAKSNLKWMMSGGYMGNGVYRSEQYSKGVALFHYIIDRDGTIYDIINPHNFVYHSSTGGNSSKQTGFDRNTIGIELTNPDRENHGYYTPQQYFSLVWLYTFLVDRFPKMKYIYGHGSIKREKTGKNKVCPGPNFDWKRFGSYLEQENISVNISDEKIKVI